MQRGTLLTAGTNRINVFFYFPKIYEVIFKLIEQTCKVPDVSEGFCSETTNCSYNRCFSYTALASCFKHSFIQGVQPKTEPRRTARDK
jgi:hypothetical protein